MLAIGGPSPGGCSPTSDDCIRKTAAKYYAGGSWSKFLYTYGSATLSRMNKFEDDIAAISG